MCRINKRGKIVYKVSETQLNIFVYHVYFYQKLKRVIISSKKIAKLNYDKFGPIVYSNPSKFYALTLRKELKIML